MRAMELTWEEEREKREILGDDWDELGREDGKAWAERAQLKDWNHLRHRQQIFEAQDRPRWAAPPPHLPDIPNFRVRLAEYYARVQRQDDEFLDWLYEEHGGVNPEVAEREYMSAWLACTDTAWSLHLEMRGRQ